MKPSISLGLFLLTFWTLGCKSNPNTNLQSPSREVSIDPNAVTIDGAQLLQAAYVAEQGSTAEFDAVVFDLGTKIAESAAQSLAMSEGEKAALRDLLAKESPQIAAQAREAYLTKIAPLNVTDSSIISHEFSTRADVLAAALNGTTCSFSSLVFIPLGIQLSLPSAIGASYAMQSPCEAVLQPLMARVGEKIHKAAIVRDIEITTSRLVLHKQSLLAEIAVADMAIDVEVSRSIYRTFSPFGKRLAKWKAANATIQYNAHLKYGFDLSSELKVSFDKKANQIVVQLSEPQLLSCELDPLLTDIEDGGIKDIDAAVMRDLYDEARQKAVGLAEQRQITTTAQRHAQTFFGLLFAPFASDFKVTVQFSTNQSNATQS